MKQNRILSSIIFCGILLGACEEIKVYDPEPSISYKEFRYTDTTLVFEFIDGDGDLGLDQFDTIGPFNDDSSYYYNLFVTFFEYNNGEFDEIEFKIPPHNRFGVIPTPEGNNKTLQGTVEVKMNQTFPMPAPDSFMIEFFIVDRALNESNTDSTGILTSRELENNFQ
ncbi:MAG: hypothetical protein ACOCXS_01850 [Bacteroidota bacterium]